MSLKLLIADDEAIERKALGMQLSKQFPEIELLKPAANGLELLETARRERPDIVMADIEMPGMNGLQALEQLRDEDIRPYIVIMTAYSSEHYLRESLSLRVYAYLEKPIRRERMENTVRALLEEIRQARSREAELQRMRGAIQSVRKMIRSELMTNIESDEADPGQISELMNMLELNARRYLIMTFSMADIAEEGRSGVERSLAELNAFETVRALVREKGWIDGHIINHRMACLVPVELNVERDDDYRLRQAACFEADDILKKIDDIRGVRVGIGMSTAQPRRLQRSRQQSVQALYRQDSRAAICHYDDQPLPAKSENLFVTEEAQLAEYLQSGDIARATACVRGCFEAVPDWVSFDFLRSQAFELLLAMNRRSGAQLFEGLTTRVSEALQQCRDRQALADYVVALCEECVRQRRSDDSRWQEDIIEKATRYIEACYNTDITLETTAEAIGVSRFYLSRLFKTHLGMNYSAFLTEKRVGMAGTLLQTQGWLSNREIAERVGFHDPDYFGKVFKRQMGCTMTEYRDKIK